MGVSKEFQAVPFTIAVAYVRAFRVGAQEISNLYGNYVLFGFQIHVIGPVF